MWYYKCINMRALLHRTAEKYLDRLNKSDRDRINAALDDLEKEPPEGDITPLAGESGRFRTRVGNCRLLWRVIRKKPVKFRSSEKKSYQIACNAIRR